MRLYHAILVLSLLIVGMNATFQAVWLSRFSQVRESVEEFGSNWLPAVRLASALARLAGEYRRMEMGYLLTDDQRELAVLARRMNRLGTAMESSELRLAALMGTRPERDALSTYWESRNRFLEEHRDILAETVAGHPEVARNISAKGSAQHFAAMMASLETIERLNQESGEAAVSAAGRLYRRVASTMLVVGLGSIALAVAAAVLAARRISRPIAELAACMATMPEDEPPACSLKEPGRAVAEVSLLYRAFRRLTQQLALSMKRLEDLAVTDQLTGVANRHKLMEEGSRALDLCQRAGSPCSALMIDIDHFKRVNDSHGHAAGDAVLRHVARELARHVRASDLLARYGGEEFVVLAPNSGPEEAVQLAERLRRGVEAHPALAEGTSLPVTVSVGVAGGQLGPKDFDTLLHDADTALYDAKHKGRNRVATAHAA